MAALPANPILSKLAENADHVDYKVFEGQADLRNFVAALLGYSPAWLRFLYRVRGWLAKVLRLDHPKPDGGGPLKPEDVPMTHGAQVGPWTVVGTEAETLWAAKITDSHLDAVLADVCQAGGTGFKHYLVTIVHYKHWTGPLYFNLIRPFHHLVVWAMGSKAAKAGQ